MAKLAVIKIRSDINARQDVKNTLRMLGLTRINHCVLVDDSDSVLGMLQKVKDYVTWGEISSDVLKRLLAKRGRLVGDKKLTDEIVKDRLNFPSLAELAAAVENEEVKLEEIGVKKVFRLHPPSKGYKSIKRSVRDLGDLGYRGEKINDLLLRMI
ncbi:MAG: 50S ribosomal protein L30 [Candidatus Hadarchaeum sp.]|uniref:50S ribosomal protein L30 n=1 Tax=Candidatus Hadarchaeum sp. TaxID=2883567 RepID=UPI003D12ECAC